MSVLIKLLNGRLLCWKNFFEKYVLKILYYLKKFKAPNSSVVRLLDRGMLVDQNQQGMEFIVLEKAEISIRKYINEVNLKKLILLCLDH